MRFYEILIDGKVAFTSEDNGGQGIHFEFDGNNYGLNAGVGASITLVNAYPAFLKLSQGEHILTIKAGIKGSVYSTPSNIIASGTFANPVHNQVGSEIYTIIFLYPLPEITTNTSFTIKKGENFSKVMKDYLQKTTTNSNIKNIDSIYSQELLGFISPKTLTLKVENNAKLFEGLYRYFEIETTLQDSDTLYFSFSNEIYGQSVAIKYLDIIDRPIIEITQGVWEYTLNLNARSDIKLGMEITLPQVNFNTNIDFAGQTGISNLNIYQYSKLKVISVRHVLRYRSDDIYAWCTTVKGVPRGL